MKFGLLDIYSLYIAHFLNNGAFLRKGKISSTSIKADYNIIMTKQSIKKIFRITVIKPINKDLAFLDLIRDKMFEECPNVRTNFNMTMTPSSLNITSEKFINSFSRAADKYEVYKEVFESQEGVAKITGKTYRLPGGGSVKLSKKHLEALQHGFESFNYVYQYVGNGGSMMQTTLFIEAVADDIKLLNRYSQRLRSLCTQLEIDCVEVKGATKAYLNEFGPATPPKDKINKKFQPQLLMSDENISAFSTYKSRGLVGGSGILFGMDYRSKLPLCVNLFESASAQVCVIGGKTGSGKTFAAFQLALSLAAEGVAISAIDIKGREWVKISKYIDCKVITFDEQNPSFVNTLRLDDMYVTRDNAQELYNTAVNGTVMLLSIIVGLPDNDERITDLNMFLREAVQKLFSINNVNPENPDSFINSRNITYSDLMPILSDLTLCASYTDEQKNVATLARSRCYAYLGESGLFSDAFSKEITLHSVVSTPLVIYEFNKNSGVMTDTLDVIRIFMVQFLDTKKKAQLKKERKFLACFYEELQRSHQFGNLLEYICADVTGSRSNNVLIFLLLNSLKVLNMVRSQDIKSNITSFIMGRMEKMDAKIMREDFGQYWIADQLDIFNQRPMEYPNCFAAHLDTGAHVYETVYKVITPEHVTKVFTTRDTRSDMSV